MELQEKLLKSLKEECTYKEIQKLDNEKILEEIIPKVRPMKLVGECKYHVVNAFDHSIYSLKEFEEIINQKDFFPNHLKLKIESYLSSKVDSSISKLELLKLGVFLHDIGKPDSRTIDETGRAHFRGHEIVGADIAFELGKKLELTSQAVDTLCKYIKNHMMLLVLFKTNDMSKDRLFDIFDMLGEDIIGITLLGYSDIVATRKLLDPNEDMGVIKTYMEYVLTNYLYKYKK
ncbi:MAG: HD domain-containing protein [Peptostreptococcaceae bacterium]